jgi:uncharacterized pyridoxamine 5'-phosphate oxidase family protein
MTGMTSKDRTNLLINISQVYILLNGQTSNRRNATYSQGFKPVRYAVILLAAISLENFKAQTLVIKGTPFYNLYRLEKVAAFLRLEYDRTKQAKKIYDDLERKGEVTKTVSEDNRTYVSLTEKGKKSCVTKMQELHDLKDYFDKIPSLQDKYEEDGSSSTFDARSKSNDMIDLGNKVQKLIKSISE